MTGPRGRVPSLRSVLVIAALLRLPSFAHGVISDDEAIYDAMGQVIAAGGVMYRDTVDHKPPGLASTYALCRMLSGPHHPALSMALVHLVGLLCALATCAAIHALARRILHEKWAAWAALLYAIVSTAKQPADGLAVNGELMMNLPIVLCALAVLVAGERRGPARLGLDAIAGALLGVAILYKYQAGFIALALPFLLEPDLPGRPTRRFVGQVIGRAATWLLGLLLPLGAVALYFHRHGALDDALFWGLRFNRAYLAQGPGVSWAARRLAMQVPGVLLTGIALYGGGAVGLAALFGDASRRSRPDILRDEERASMDVVRGRRFLVVWTLASLYCVTLGQRFFGHYFLQAEPPLALLAAGPIARLYAHAPRRALLILAGPALALGLIATSPALCHRVWNADDPDYEAVGRAVAAQTAGGDAIWVWGNVPQIYFAADRVAGARFTFCNYITGLSPATPSEYGAKVEPREAGVPGALALALADLERHPPSLLLDTAEHDLKHYGRFPLERFAPLAELVRTRYRRGETVAGVVLYHRLEQPAASR